MARWNAAALLAIGALAACSTSDDGAEDNPNYNPKTGEVPVNFVFNVAVGNTPETRMSAADTQADITQAFRGITNAALLTHKQANDGRHLYSPLTVDNYYDLATVLSANALDPDNADGQTAKSRRVIELSLPTGTNTLLFYGKAIRATGTTDESVGKISFNPPTDKDLDASSFKLAKRIDNGNDSICYDQIEYVITTVLTRVAKNGFNGSESYNSSAMGVVEGTSVNLTGKSLNWSDYAQCATGGTGKSPIPVEAYSPALSEAKNAAPLEVILGNAYVAFTTIGNKEARAGSGASIARQIGDLWAVIDDVRSATPFNDEERVAIVMASRIATRLANYFTAKGTGCQWLTKGYVVSNLTSHLNDTEKAELSKNTTVLLSEDYSSITFQAFPTHFNVPMGAAQLKCEDGVFTYNENARGAGPASNSYSVHKYMYPAELCYFGNSPVRVTNVSHEVSQYPDGSADWLDDDEWTTDWTKYTDNAHVLSSTRGVAMRDNINYGTALLESTVGYTSLDLEDNNYNLNKENPNVITIDGSSSYLTLTGIIVGGQAQEMGWDYTRKNATGKFDCMVYDKAIADGAIPASTTLTTGKNYTLLWDNYDSAPADGKQSVVYVALEFVNNTGKDFWGEANLIRNGGTFYIVGKLDPTTLTVDDNTFWPTNYALPPYNSTTGATIKEKRVFIQDYKTTANFKITDESLKHAYVTVPDLRATKISLGLSVDLDWTPGLVFNNIELGK